MDDCIFCKIAKGEIPSEKEFENEEILAIQDIHPKASVHLLIIPKKHIVSLMDDNENYWQKIGETAKSLAESKKLRGFRLVHNAGESASVKHMHVHLLGDVPETKEL